MDSEQVTTESQFRIWPVPYFLSLCLPFVGGNKIRAYHREKEQSNCSAKWTVCSLGPVFQTAVYDKTAAFLLPNEMLTSLNDLHGYIRGQAYQRQSFW